MPSKSDREIEAWALRLLESGTKHYNIDPAEGAFLRDLVKSAGTRRALEIGTSNGYSGIWIAMALRETGGRLITLEADAGRYAQAKNSFAETGLDGYVDQRFGDARELLSSIDGPFEFAFLDAEKADYLKYYELALPKMRAGGVIAAHNVKSHPQEMADFLERIHTDPAVRTEIVTPGWQGFSVSRVR